MTQVWEYSSCVGAELLIMLALSDSADDDGLCFPDIADVAHKARLPIDTTRQFLKRLVRTGHLKEFKGTGYSGGNDYYQIIYEGEGNVG